MSEEAIGELADGAKVLADEASVCASGECWRAALVLVGSAIEAGIVATACCCEHDLRERDVWPRGGREPADWALGDAIVLAVRAGWLPTVEPKGGLVEHLGGEVGDAVRFLSRVRAMAVHPAAAAREEVAPDFNSTEHMRLTYEVFEGVMGAVFERLNEAVKAANEARTH